MSARRKPFSMDHPVIVLFVIIAVVASMGLAAEVLKPLALSVLLAFALTPFAKMLEKMRIPHVPAVVLTVFLALGGLAAVGYVVAGQLDRLAGDVADPKRVENMRTKLSFLNPQEHKSNVAKVTESVQEVTKSLEGPPASSESDVQNVKIVSQPEFREKLEGAVGPYIEGITIGSFVLILVLFMMVAREDLANRIVALFGKRQITLTTRTMNEVSERISRYLATNALVNAGFGLVIGLGLHFIGVPYAVLWGVIAALCRFIPYVGTVIAFTLPALYIVASFPGWREVLIFMGLFLLLEMALNSFLEPIIYGKTTGVTALGLLVAAMFWTWLWGIWGLLLSTPMTVCLAVLGKYVPALGFFATILGEEAELDPDSRYYQKLLALDQDGAGEVVEEYAKQHPRADLFENVLIKALSKAERDFLRGDIDDREQAYIWRITGEILDDLEGSSEVTLQTVEASSKETPFSGITILGIPANDHADTLALRMAGLCLDPSKQRLIVMEVGQSPLKIAARIEADAPDVVLISHLPPSGLTTARYLLKRLKSSVKNVRLVVGRWGESGSVDKSAESLASAGASCVVFKFTEARDQLMSVAPATKVADEPRLAPALA